MLDQPSCPVFVAAASWKGFFAADLANDDTVRGMRRLLTSNCLWRTAPWPSTFAMRVSSRTHSAGELQFGRILDGDDALAFRGYSATAY